MAVSTDRLPAVAAFAQVARSASFSKAAALLGVSPSALSQTVRALEARLGIRLLNRTTRRVGMTEAGARFLERVMPALEQFESAFSELENYRATPMGTLRISLPRMAMISVVAPLLYEFCAAQPQIKLDLTADDRFVDLVGEGFDAGIRFGESLARDMIAVRVSRDQRVAVVAAPEYVARHGTPRSPSDLHRHRCLRFRFSSGAIYRWEFGRNGQDLDMDVDGPLICNDNALLRDAACRGVGMAHLMEDLVREDLERGTLIRVLEDWCPAFPGFYLYYAGRRQLPLKLRVLIDFISVRLVQQNA